CCAARGSLARERALAIAAQIADALDAAHERGLVHREVKPSNALLDQQRGREHAYLADFGLTQSTSDRTVSESHMMGTVDDVAQEQIRGDDVDGRADIYALGCLLFETRARFRSRARRTWPSSSRISSRSRRAHPSAIPLCRRQSTRCSLVRWRKTATSGRTA